MPPTARTLPTSLFVLNLARGCLLVLLTATGARALTWDATVRELKLEAGTPTVTVEFPFTNPSRSPVTITGVKSTCDCSVADLPEKPIPPGGTGVLKVRYDPGTTLGQRTVPVEVTTDEPDSKPTVLHIKATLEPVLTITPVLLRWIRHTDADTRTATLQNVSRHTLTSVTLLPPPDTLTATLAPGKKTGTWIVSLTPKSTLHEMTARVQVHAEVDGRTLTYSVFAIVR